jgi:hypothetical protein
VSKPHGGARPNTGPKRAGPPDQFLLTVFAPPEQVAAFRRLDRAAQATIRQAARRAALAALANQDKEPTMYVVVVDDASALVGVHELGPDDTYQSATGAHGRVAKETPDLGEARKLFDSYIRQGYTRNGGILAALAAGEGE